MTKARQQQVFLQLTNTLNRFSAPSANSFSALDRNRQERIKISYHNYLDGCEEAIRRECKFKDLKNKVIERYKKGSTKATSSQEEELYPERLLRWYKNIQRYYIDDLKIDDFEIPYHPDDPHMDRNHIVKMDLVISKKEKNFR